MKSLRLKTFLFLLLFILTSKLVSAQVKSDSLDAKQLHMITYKHFTSKHYNSWSIQYREFEKQSDEFEIPITLSFGSTKMDEKFLEDKNITDVETYTLGLGFDGYEFLGQGFYYNLGIGASPGLETVEKQNERKDTKFLIGCSISTGLLYVPFPDYGFVIGINITGRLSNSRVLNHSLGFGIEVGFNF